jgi:putative peptidoglycan lipid II flippase
MNTIVRSKAARANAEGSEQATQRILAQGFRLMSLVLIPIALFVVVLRRPIAQLLLASEQLDAATHATAAMMGCFAAGYPAAGLVGLLLTAFEARGDTTTPSIQRLVILALNLALDVALVRYAGVVGIAVAYAAADVTWLLWISLSMRRQPVARPTLWETGFLLRLGLGALAASISFWGASAIGRAMLPAGWLGLVLSIALSALTGGVAFAIVETALGVEEFQLVLKWLRTRWAAVVQWG